MGADYDLALGVITHAVDFNGQPLLFRYDPLARLTAIVKPGDSLTLPTLVFGYTLGGAVSAVTTESRERSGTTEVFRSVSYVDGLGRQLQTRTEGERGKGRERRRDLQPARQGTGEVPALLCRHAHPGLRATGSG